MRVTELYEINRKQPSLEFLDVDTSKDIKLYLNAKAIRQLESDWGDHCEDLLKSFFNEVLEAAKLGKNSRGLELLSKLSEPNETHLGQSRGESNGRGLGPKKAREIWSSFKASKAVKTGVLEDLEDTVLLIDGISTDILSDIITNVIRGPLISFTQRMCEKYSIPMADQVDSGPVWNPKAKIWERDFVSLPMPNDEKLILIPKSIVRLNSGYDVSKYYRHYVLERLKDEELKSDSGLVTIIKGGKKRVYKTDVIAKYGSKEKEVSIAQTNNFPDILAKFKSENSDPTSALSHEQIADVQGTKKPDWAKLLDNVKKLTPGRKDAYKYEDAILDLMIALFHPALVDPDTQTPLHDGLKRVDITFTNYATSGFFWWLAKNYPSPYVIVECKNFGSEMGNPELDQIAMRMADRKGKFGIVFCRSIENRKRMTDRCKAIMHDDEKYIICLDDNDLTALVKEAAKIWPQAYEFPTLSKRFKELVF